MTSKVYFTRDISAEGVLKVYEKLGAELGKKVAIKLHSGEKAVADVPAPISDRTTHATAAA